MSEEIEKRIEEVKKRLDEIELDLSLLEVRLWSLRRDIAIEGSRKGGLTTWFRRYIREDKKIRAEYIKRRLDATERKLDKLRERRYDVVGRIKRLEEERERLLEELKKIILHEVIDIDESTGYLILYDINEKKYFLVSSDDYAKGIVEVEKYFETLEITLNYTFDTITADDERKRLMAELRIVLKVSEFSKKMVDAIVDKTDAAFEQHIIDKFSTRFFEERTREDYSRAAVIAKGVRKITQKTLEFFGVELQDRLKKKLEQIKDIHDVVPEIAKVGVFFRVSDEAPNVDIDEEVAEPEIGGEWSRGAETDYAYQEPFAWTEDENERHYRATGRYYKYGFDLTDWFTRREVWHMLRSRISGKKIEKKESDFEQLRRLREEE